MNIKIYNLSQNIDDRALARLFHPYGVVNSAIVDRNSLNGRSRGNGMVEMPIHSEAMQAIVSLHQTTVDGKQISVSEWMA
ncbi:MAG: RNA-binding protein [Niastella sp.]|nr:RNA-binding protein [Niastella sp.]